MKAKKLNLPSELQTFVKSGNTTFFCEDGDWDLRIIPGDKSPFRAELPARSLMIAENGCGDCLFLKISVKGEVGTKVFVFWHEEGRCGAFAKHVKDLVVCEARPIETLASSVPAQSMPLGELEAALNSSDRKVRKDAIWRFEKTAFEIDALPLLRRALDDDWVEVVLAAAKCIAQLGPEALSCPAGQAASGRDRVKLDWQLFLAGSKVWSYSLCPNCYPACLDALVKLKADGELIVEYVENHIGLGDDFLIDSLKALKEVGSPEALSLLKRVAAFWLPELNMRYAKQVKEILATIGKRAA